MLATAIIIFREALEIAIIVGVVLAATKGIARRGLWVLAGFGAGVVGAGGIAFFAGVIAEGLDGMGQQVMNGVILLLAAIMIGWTVIWMKTHARELTARIKKAGMDISEGHVPLYSITVIIALAVLREGAEIVLFLFGIAASKQDSFWSMMLGGGGGLLAGGAVGLLFYFGLLRLSRKYFFTVTSVLLIFLAAGMAAQSVGFFSSAGMISEMGTVWDSSWLLRDSSIAGKTLHAMIGYTARPSGMQVLFYCATLLIITALSWGVNQTRETVRLVGMMALIVSFQVSVVAGLLFAGISMLKTI